MATENPVDLVMQLMTIPGRSGDEAAVADFVRLRLLKCGIPESTIRFDSANRRTAVRSETGNLILKLPGTVRAPRRMFSAHLDTVPICVGARPKRQGNLIRPADTDTGLGADDRAGVALLLHTVMEIQRLKLPHPPLTFCWFVQEETGLHGSRHVSKTLLGKPTMAFNWDGGSPAKLTIGATGGYRMNIEIGGIASHAGNAPERGVSAITIASVAIADLHHNGWLGDVRKGRARGTSNVGVIRGGDATNVVTDRVTIAAEARSHDPKFRGRMIKAIEAAFQKAAGQIANDQGRAGTAKIEGRLDYESYRLERTAECVQLAAAAAEAEDMAPEFAISNGGLDANWLVLHGIPTVSLGCGQLNQHMTSEALDVTAFEDACRMALRLATV